MNVKILADIGLEEVGIDAGATILKEGTSGRKVYVLISGAVAVKAKGTQIAAIDDPGAVVGEIAALLGTAHVATVSTMEDSTFYVIEDLIQFVHEHPDAGVSIAQMLACRLVNMNNHFVYIKDQIQRLQANLDSYLPVFPDTPQE